LPHPPTRVISSDCGILVLSCFLLALQVLCKLALLSTLPNSHRHSHFRMQVNMISALLIASLACGAIADEVSCWAPDGATKADNTTYVPCNKLGIEQHGVFSSCCQLDGKPEERDLCTTRGLCLRNGVTSRGYCTDKTWKSAACVNVCTSDEDGGNPEGTVEMTDCTDGTYCCGLNNLNCCGTDRAFKIPTQESVVEDGGANNSDSDDDSSTFKNATIGLGAALGVVLLLALGSIFWLARKIKLLRRQLDEKSRAETAPAPAPHAAQSYQPTMTATSPGISEYTYSKPVFGAVPGSPRPSEIHGESRYSELDAIHSSTNAVSPPPHVTDFDHSPRGSPLPSPGMYPS
jgi:hypothetical protein